MKEFSFTVQTCVFILLLNGARSITLANRRYTLTYHDYKKTWNEALAICRAFNGGLMKLDSPERTNALEAFIPTWPHEHIWIGLHYPSTESNDRYGWLDCVLPVYTNWYHDEPKHTSTERCSYRNKDHGQWKSHECDSTKQFVCQIDEGPCTFTQSNGVPDPSTEYEAITISETNIDNCLGRCLSVTYDNTNCWSVNYNGTTCVLYYTSLPFLFTSLDRTTDSIDFYTKDCFSSSIDTVDDTPVTVTNGPEPNTNCTIFTNQSTPTTSWTTSSTSTTTSSTTSSTASTTSSTSATTSSTTRSTSTTTSSTTSSTSSTTSSTSSTTSSTSATTSSTTSTPSILVPTTSSTTPKTTTLSSILTTTNLTTTPRTISSTTTPKKTSSTALPTSTSSTPKFTSTTTKSTTASSNEISLSTTTVSSTTGEPTVTSGSINSLNTTQSTPGTTRSISPFVSTTSKHSNESSTIDPTEGNRTCLCNCTSVTSLLSNLTLPQKLELIRLKLKLDFKALSSSIRKKTSAPDNRTSAKSVGYVAVVFVCLELSIFLVIDFFKFYLKR